MISYLCIQVWKVFVLEIMIPIQWATFKLMLDAKKKVIAAVGFPAKTHGLSKNAAKRPKREIVKKTQ